MQSYGLAFWVMPLYKEDQSLFCFLVLFISFHLITDTACYPGLSVSLLSLKAGSVAKAHR